MSSLISMGRRNMTTRRDVGGEGLRGCILDLGRP